MPVQEQTGAATAILLTGLGIDEYLARTDAQGRRVFLTDALGSTIALTDDTGAVVTEYTYDPFGTTTATGAASGNPFQYTGREHDGATGLYQYRTRYYSPALHRFLSEDQLEVEPWDANLYTYVGNDPVNFVDPYGEEALALTPRSPRGLPGYAGAVEVMMYGLATLFFFYICLLLCPLMASGPGLGDGSKAGSGAGPKDPAPGKEAAGKDGDAGDAPPAPGVPKPPALKVPRPGVSGKEGAKDVPSWAKGQRPRAGESGKDFAERLMDDKYGEGNYKKRGTGEYSKIKKWGDRAFEDP